MTGWMIYGASGYTGRLVAAEARRRGLRPVLAGRDPAAVARLAGELGLPWRAFPLSDPGELRGGLAGVDAVLHCAGPFVATAPPMLAACLAAGVAYLDITGEPTVLEATLGRAEEARAAGVALVGGVGFDVVPTDCLAARLHDALPDATHLELAFAGGGGWSAGTLRTSLEHMAAGGAERRDGRIVRVPLARDVIEVDFPHRRLTCASIPWGDVATAFHTTGIPNVRVYRSMHPDSVRRLRRLRPLLPVLRIRPLRRLLQWWVGRTVHGPGEATRASARTWVWGRVWNRDGDAITGTVETPEGYAFTASAAVEAAVRVAGGAITPGAWTPARAFGAGFAAELPGVTEGPLRPGRA